MAIIHSFDLFSKNSESLDKPIGRVSLQKHQNTSRFFSLIAINLAIWFLLYLQAHITHIFTHTPVENISANIPSYSSFKLGNVPKYESLICSFGLSRSCERTFSFIKSNIYRRWRSNAQWSTTVSIHDCWRHEVHGRWLDACERDGRRER